MLGNSVVMRTRLEAISLAMITMRKSTYGLFVFTNMGMRLRLVVLRTAGAPLKMSEKSRVSSFHSTPLLQPAVCVFH